MRGSQSAVAAALCRRSPKPACQTRCADSDFGDAPLVRGVLTPAAGAPRADYCVRSHLLEWNCGPNNLPAFRHLNCTNGCANGAQRP